MPQVTIELSDSIQVDESLLLQAVNQALDASGVFRLQDIKSRLYRSEHVLIGDGSCGQGFVYAKVAIMPGRNDAIKAQLGASVLGALKFVLDEDNLGVQYGVEVVDLSEHYFKL
ncbi:5-carboxymethyl-2-hydroxymuconate Delta-isomerase [Moraxella porci]|uniref:5-carboxymethyl-2-hydroxymuconate Delta-isomerase n=1 Tax=Moraxella porci TaxID=1288392 RepID=UPI00244BB219|nr:5-carboxymethyl-2-hydroxymuconate Delta-isomerase [Moraxella porci]MDH2273945.1 5-carboxymethyl-2-hydroxymuconate Delta-isomerase [Moraxella porci]